MKWILWAQAAARINGVCSMEIRFFRNQPALLGMDLRIWLLVDQSMRLLIFYRPCKFYKRLEILKKKHKP